MTSIRSRAGTVTSSAQLPHRVAGGAAATSPRVVDLLGGKRGAIDGGLPPLVFVAVNAIASAHVSRSSALASAIGAAVATGLAIVALRLVRKETLKQAVGGLVGLTIAALFAARSGEAHGFFLPGIYVDAAYAIVSTLRPSSVGRWSERFTPCSTEGYVTGGGRRACAGSSRLRRWAGHSCSRRAPACRRSCTKETGQACSRPASCCWGPLTILAVMLTHTYLRRTSADKAWQ